MEIQKRTSSAHPLLLFSELKKAKCGEEREKLARGLEALEDSFPEGLRMGAAVFGGGDSFFHSVAQGLNELTDQRSFTVTSLRRDVEAYARGGAASVGDVRLQGKIVSKRHGVKLRVTQLGRDDVVTRHKIGKSDRVVHLVTYRSHCVPLLRNIDEHVKRRVKVPREQVYGREASEVTADGGNPRKRRRSATLGNSGSAKMARQDEGVADTSHFIGGKRKDLFDIQIRLAKTIGKREGTRAFRQVLHYLDTEEGIKCLDIVRRNEEYLPNMSSILNRAGLEGVKAFKELHNLWFDEQGNKSKYLESIEGAGIRLSTISNIINNAGVQGPRAFLELYYLWFDEGGNLTHYLKTLEKEKISLTSVSSILSNSGINCTAAFRDLFHLWIDEGGNKTRYLRSLETVGLSVRNMTSILNSAGSKAAVAFKQLFDLLIDEDGNKTAYLKVFEDQKIKFSSMSNILNKAGCKATEAFKELHDLLFNEDGSKTRYLVTLEKEENIQFENVATIFHGTKFKAAKVFKELHSLWFKEDGSKTQLLTTLQKEKINLRTVSSILNQSGAKAPATFLELYNLWFDKDGNKTKHLRSLEEEGIDLVTICGSLKGKGSKAPSAFRDLYERCFNQDRKGRETLKNVGKLVTKVDDEVPEVSIKPPDIRFDREGSRDRYLQALEDEGVKLSSIVGARGPLTELLELWFDHEGNKTSHLKSLEGVGVNLGIVCSILSGTGPAAPAVFREVYELWFDDERGKKSRFLRRLEREGISLATVARLLRGRGSTAINDFKDLFHLLFDQDGNRSKLLDEFYEAGYGPEDLSMVLSMAGYVQVMFLTTPAVQSV